MIAVCGSTNHSTWIQHFSFHYQILNNSTFHQQETMNTFDYKNIQITDFLAEKGHQPTAKKGANWWYLSPFHTECTPSFKVDVNKNVWYDFSIGKGGNIITLVSMLYQTDSFPDLLQHIKSVKQSDIPVYSQKQKENTTFTNIVTKELCNPALLAYLASRGICESIATRYCKEIHYTSNGKNYFAVGFPNRTGGYELRNPYFKGCIAPKDVSIVDNGNDICHVFEGFIDFLSYIVLYGNCDAVILNSIVNAPKAVEVLDRYKEVACHLDNDDAGKKTTKLIVASCHNHIVDASIEYAGCKDLNEYLCKKIKEELHG